MLQLKREIIKLREAVTNLPQVPVVVDVINRKRQVVVQNVRPVLIPGPAAAAFQVRSLVGTDRFVRVMIERPTVVVQNDSRHSIRLHLERVNDLGGEPVRGHHWHVGRSGSLFQDEVEVRLVGYEVDHAVRTASFRYKLTD